MSDRPDSAPGGRLVVVEDDTGFLAVRADDPADWLARFDKGVGFPARSWAENMVNVWNTRLTRQDGGARWARAAPPPRRSSKGE